MQIGQFTQTLNQWGNQRIPFLFLVDFEMERPVVLKLSDIDPNNLRYDFNGFTNADRKSFLPSVSPLIKKPISMQSYREKFDKVLDALSYGDTYLVNLTVKTEIETESTLEELFFASRAKYKLWYRNEFLVFSPEIFVQIRDGKIFSNPMKGTIDAGIDRAAQIILADNKEIAEHVTIVDLIRNDLSRVANDVFVKRFRYIDELVTNQKKLLQVSSEIVGTLRPDYCAELGDIITELLPAGSVSGAPKNRTVEILRETEGEKRGFYTGVMGIFDGTNVDSGVMIRFIERVGNKLYYRSGGGITSQSIMENEYKEAIDKVYVPVD